MTYDELLRAIQRYMEDTSVELQVLLPTVVKQAEIFIFRTLPELPCYQKEATVTFQAVSTISRNPDTYSFAYPDGMLVIDNVTVDQIGTDGQPFTPLVKRTESYVTDIYPEPRLNIGSDIIPDMYYTRNYRIHPRPLGLTNFYSFHVEGRGMLPELGPSNQTNWISENAQGVLLNTCLVEAGKAMFADDNIMAGYAAHQASEIENLRREAVNNEMPRAGKIA